MQSKLAKIERAQHLIVIFGVNLTAEEVQNTLRNIIADISPAVNKANSILNEMAY